MCLGFTTSVGSDTLHFHDMAKSGLLSPFLNRVKKVITGKEYVGLDNFGNRFFVKLDKDDHGQAIERRLMEPPGGTAHSNYNPQAINPLWRQWLSKTRMGVPSAEELSRRVHH